VRQSNEGLRDLAQRLVVTSYRAQGTMDADDTRRPSECDQIDVLQQKVDDLTEIVVELVGRLVD